MALEQVQGPVCLLLTREDVPVLDPRLVHDGVARGADVLREPDGTLDVVLVASGSEVSVALEAQDQLAGCGVGARVVSMPSWELFEEQDDRYRGSVLPRGVPAVSLEAGVAQGWSLFANASVSIERFGASAPGAEVLQRLGIAPEQLAAAARHLIRCAPRRGSALTRHPAMGERL